SSLAQDSASERPKRLLAAAGAYLKVKRGQPQPSMAAVAQEHGVPYTTLLRVIKRGGVIAKRGRPTALSAVEEEQLRDLVMCESAHELRQERLTYRKIVEAAEALGGAGSPELRAAAKHSHRVYGELKCARAELKRTLQQALARCCQLKAQEEASRSCLWLPPWQLTQWGEREGREEVSLGAQPGDQRVVKGGWVVDTRPPVCSQELLDAGQHRGGGLQQRPSQPKAFTTQAAAGAAATALAAVPPTPPTPPLPSASPAAAAAAAAAAAPTESQGVSLRNSQDLTGFSACASPTQGQLPAPDLDPGPTPATPPAPPWDAPSQVPESRHPGTRHYPGIPPPLPPAPLHPLPSSGEASSAASVAAELSFSALSAPAVALGLGHGRNASGSNPALGSGEDAQWDAPHRQQQGGESGGGVSLDHHSGHTSHPAANTAFQPWMQKHSRGQQGKAERLATTAAAAPAMTNLSRAAESLAVVENASAQPQGRSRPVEAKSGMAVAFAARQGEDGARIDKEPPTDGEEALDAVGRRLQDHLCRLRLAAPVGKHSRVLATRAAPTPSIQVLEAAFSQPALPPAIPMSAAEALEQLRLEVVGVRTALLQSTARV
ncbi:hypothetical protein QJQ45_018389, partial [Haematococcus lacustris]